MIDQYVAHNSNTSALALAGQALGEDRLTSAAQLYQLAALFLPELAPAISKMPEQLVGHSTELPPLTVLLWCSRAADIPARLQELTNQPYPVRQVVLYAASAEVAAALSAQLVSTNSELAMSLAFEVVTATTLMWQHYIQHQSSAEQLVLALAADTAMTSATFYQHLAQELYSAGSSLLYHATALSAVRLTAASNLPELTLVLSLATDCAATAEQLNATLAWLGQYFRLTLALTAASPEWVFDNPAVMALLKSGQLARLQVTDQARFFARDSIEFVKKLPAEQVLLCSLNRFSQHALAIYRYFYCANRPLVDAQSIVASVAPQQLARLDDTGFSTLAAVCFAGDAADSVHGFTTAAAVKRLGGETAMSALPLCYAAEPFAKITRWWQLVAGSLPVSNVSPQTGWRDIAQSLELAGNMCLLFDLQPAAEIQDPLYRYTPVTSLRRWLLTARLLPQTPEIVERPAAYFVMTNYNKARFLADSVYSVLLQSYADCQLLLLDDGSNDQSLAVIAHLQSWLPSGFLTLQQGKGKAGTYRLRNKAIASLAATTAVYLVNDADDLSSARRAELQLRQLTAHKLCYTFGDIVRVNAAGEVFLLDGSAERYGTASFCAPAALHQQYGYFENLRKGADTEFIERLARFAPKNSGLWWRYPLLFQSFDGNNLTSDIYAIAAGGELAQDISARSRYMTLFRARHNRLLAEWLPQCFSADNNEFPQAYIKELPDFFMPEAKVLAASDSNVLHQFTAQMLQQAGFEPLPAGVTLEYQPHAVVIATTLTSDKHAYIMLKQRFNPQQFQSDKFASLAMYFDVAQQLGISACLIYQDEQGEQISHQFFWANQLMPVKLADNCYQVQLGFRLQGSGTATINMLEVHAR